MLKKDRGKCKGNQMHHSHINCEKTRLPKNALKIRKKKKKKKKRADADELSKRKKITVDQILKNFGVDFSLNKLLRRGEVRAILVITYIFVMQKTKLKTWKV